MESTGNSTLAADPRHLLVIGAGPGIGAGTARRFAREGFRITLVARRTEPLTVLAEELEGLGAQVHVVTADASDVPEYEAVLRSLYAGVGSPGVVVYNAVSGSAEPLLTIDSERLRLANNVNVVSAVVTAQVAAPHLRAAGGGTILYTGGGLADYPSGAYASASLGKAALRAAATILAGDLADDNIHVASITINGAVEYGTPFDPNLIGDEYWTIHLQPRESWVPESPYNGR
ncbi:SDR family NAD(P)-dependent oxidoreductase [Curtobacterium sp. MCPF17_046]|uniref:SDR family NAD(P)-dependent oxidoreductase n=1 Tax=Curtobacterium sp. MCPF17_046 TaxID=2175663 RepID=UPI000D8802F6|nr:SDR family NAD(P)-dependent oxidoreductase [Curtobacterium sp. MCPF17_046]PYY39719.1 short-chain dehydrogenase [Curtobacterium sp. MCPF17_046]